MVMTDFDLGEIEKLVEEADGGGVFAVSAGDGSGDLAGQIKYAEGHPLGGVPPAIASTILLAADEAGVHPLELTDAIAGIVASNVNSPRVAEERVED